MIRPESQDVHLVPQVQGRDDDTGELELVWLPYPSLMLPKAAGAPRSSAIQSPSSLLV